MVIGGNAAFYLARDRIVAKNKKDYDTADKIRNFIIKGGWRVEDREEGTIIIRNYPYKCYLVKNKNI